MHPHAPMSFWPQIHLLDRPQDHRASSFLFVSLFFLLVGGLLAMQIRWQLGFPGKPMPGGRDPARVDGREWG